MVQRNWGLIYKLLDYTEANARVGALDAPDVEGYDEVEVHYHIGLCRQAKYLDALEAKVPDDKFQRFQILRLTWKGHQQLDYMREESEHRRRMKELSER